MKFVMRRRAGATRLLAALVLAAATAVGVPSLIAPAQAYPTVSCSVNVPTHAVKPGHKFAVSGTSSVVETWTASFNGVTKKFNGKNFATDFLAPTKPGNYSLSVSCSGSSGAQTLGFSIKVAGAGANNGGGGKLPDTGGPNLWWFIAGGGAIVAGAALIGFRRRRVSP